MASIDHTSHAARGCPVCHATSPVAAFCGRCGAEPVAPVSPWRSLLRPRVYATAHREPVWIPRLGSTYLPRLPGPALSPFRIALFVVLVLIIGFAVMRVNGPLGVTATIGWPLVFLIYVWQSDGFRDIPLRILAVAMVIGVACGVGWWLVTGKLLARSYGISTGSGLMLTRVLDVGIVIPLGGALLMLLPAVITRLMRMPVRESLDGFVIGTFGALWYQTAATTTVLAPQFVEGLIEEHTVGRMLQDSITYGVVYPIVTAAAGGLVGLTLWFRPDPHAEGRGPVGARAALIVCSVLAFVIYLAVWGVWSTNVPRAVDIVVKLILGVLALLVTRCAIQIALLNEEWDPATGEPVLCVHCDRVVPDVPFCPACGAAARASSRTSRQFRREHTPVPQRTDAT